MKQIFFLLILILWSVLQARRKALREQKRQASAPAALGAVQSDEAIAELQSAPSATEPPDRWNNRTAEADRFVGEASSDVPEEVRAVLRAARRSRNKPAPVFPAPVSVAEIQPQLAALPPIEDAYALKSASVRRGISFDKESIRTYVVTREVLGPPRSRKPFRASLRGHE